LSHDAKRSGEKLDGFEHWYPYYAGFTAKFTQKVFEISQIPKSSVILDPWNGSGTTTSVADQMGYSAIGYDINPVAALVANAKLARPQDAAHTLGLVKKIVNAIKKDPKNIEETQKDPLAAWVHINVVHQYRQIESIILSDLATKNDDRIINPRIEALPPLAAFFLLSLMRATKQLASIGEFTNPTWVRPGNDVQNPQQNLRA
jgi:DNA methylase